MYIPLSEKDFFERTKEIVMWPLWKPAPVHRKSKQRNLLADVAYLTTEVVLFGGAISYRLVFQQY